MNSFNKFNLPKQLQKALDNNNYIEPTPIQSKVIPLVLENYDLLVQAQTSSGKTASFVLPLITKWLENPIEKRSKKDKIKILILVPTRELALQVTNTFKLFSTYLPYKPKVITLIGGDEIGKQLLDIQKGCDIIVATSGRLFDIIDKKQINLNFVEHFILDEADKILDLGFIDELQELLKLLPKQKQTLLFSATYSTKILSIIDTISITPKKITLENSNNIVETIQQKIILVNSENRSALLRELIRKNRWQRVLVFMSSKRATDNISAKFRKYGFLAESFHGDLIQDDRVYTLDQFKDKKIKILFSTDIASRGLHIDNIDCVINYDLPRSSADYIHRIGRTGRAGQDGIAISFVGLDDMEHLQLIEKKIKTKIPQEQIDGFEIIGEFTKKSKGQAPIKGKRKSKKDKLREMRNSKS